MALAGGIGLAPAQAGGNPITVTPATVAPGEDFTVAGPADCILGSTLDVMIPELELAQTVSGDAAWSVVFTVPDDAEPGTYQVVVDGEECTFNNGTVTVAIPETISLVKTVGTTADECATTTSISVVSGTTVYYCYTITNDTESVLATHSLTDDQLGDLLTDEAADLDPGASGSTVELGLEVSADLTVTTTNVATWTATNEQGVPFTATASATVTVTTAPAVAAAADPNFTG